jgi:hypothetical protein
MQDNDVNVEAVVEPFVQLLSSTARSELSKVLAATIVKESLSQPAEASEHAIAIDRRTEQVVIFDISKALLAAARVLSTFGALVVSPSLAALSAVLACLSSLQGIRTQLPRSQAVICLLLSQMPGRRSTTDELIAAFAAYAREQPDESLKSSDIDSALAGLRRLGCLDQQDGLVVRTDGRDSYLSVVDSCYGAAFRRSKSRKFLSKTSVKLQLWFIYQISPRLRVEGGTQLQAS